MLTSWVNPEALKAGKEILEDLLKVKMEKGENEVESQIVLPPVAATAASVKTVLLPAVPTVPTAGSDETVTVDAVVGDI